MHEMLIFFVEAMKCFMSPFLSQTILVTWTLDFKWTLSVIFDFSCATAFFRVYIKTEKIPSYQCLEAEFHPDRQDQDRRELNTSEQSYGDHAWCALGPTYQRTCSFT